MDTTIAHLLESYAQRLEKAGVDTPLEDSKAILAEVTGITTFDGYRASLQTLDELQLRQAEDILRRREKREPLSKILGRTVFCDLVLETGAHVFRPCPESEDLVTYTLALLEPHKNKPLRILDLGTGTGCVLLALLKALPHASGIGVDLDESILGLARANAIANHLDERASFVTGDWGKGIDEKFDLMIANPPAAITDDIPRLAPEMHAYEPFAALDGGKDGLAFYRYAARDFRRLTKQDGLGMFQTHLKYRAVHVFRKAGLSAALKPNYRGNPACIVVRRKASTSLLKRLFG